MVTRVVVSVLLLPLLLGIVYLLPAVAVPVSIACICALAVYEALVPTGFVKDRRVVGYSILLAVCTPFWVYWGSDPVVGRGAVLFYVLALFLEGMASQKRLKVEQLGGAFFIAAFVPMFLSAFVRLRGTEDWRFVILLPMVVAFCSDIFALFAGMFFGKHKLAPQLSPKKTVEGAIGGAVAAPVCAMLYGLIFRFFVPGIMPSYLVLALYGFLGSIISQLGDLSFSFIKREFGIKDYSNLLPGHGGILDRFDSVIFCAPLIELLLYFLPVVR